MDVNMDVKIKLKFIVDDCLDSYGDADYPFDSVERAQAGNVQSALQSLGFEVSLSDAAAIWERYSLSLQAGWMSGAETVESASECLIIFCSDASSL